MADPYFRPTYNDYVLLAAEVLVTKGPWSVGDHRLNPVRQFRFTDFTRAATVRAIGCHFGIPSATRGTVSQEVLDDVGMSVVAKNRRSRVEVVLAFSRSVTVRAGLHLLLLALLALKVLPSRLP